MVWVCDCVSLCPLQAQTAQTVRLSMTGAWLGRVIVILYGLSSFNDNEHHWIIE